MPFGIGKSKEQKAEELMKNLEAQKRQAEKSMAAGTGQSIASANQTNEGQAVMKAAAEIDQEKLKPRSEEGAAKIAEKEQELADANKANTEARLNGTETAYSGPTVDNTNEGIANAKPGDVVQRKDGTFYTLTQGDINYAQSLLNSGVEETTDAAMNPDPEPEAPANATPEQEQKVEESVEEAKPEMEAQAEEESVDQAAEQASQQTGEDKESLKEKIKRIYQMFKAGAFKPGTDAYFMADAIATTAYNIGEQMEKNFRNRLWSHTDSGNFENPEFKKSFYQQQQEADIAQTHEREINRGQTTKDKEAEADFNYNTLTDIINNSKAGEMTPEQQVKYRQIVSTMQGGQPLSAEDFLAITDLDGRVSNLLQGEARKATRENLANEAARLANQSDAIKLKYADDLLAAQLKSDELANLALAFPGEISINAKGSVPGFASVGGTVNIPYTTMINVADTLRATVSEVVDALERGDKTVLDAFKNVGERATKSKK